MGSWAKTHSFLIQLNSLAGGKALELCHVDAQGVQGVGGVAEGGLFSVLHALAEILDLILVAVLA